MNHSGMQNQNLFSQYMSMFSPQLQSVISEQPNSVPTALSRGNFYALFSQTMEHQGQPVHFDGMTSVSGLKIYKKSHIVIQNSGTYLISYSFTPCQGVTSGDFVGIKVNDNWITTSLQSLSLDEVGINKTFLLDLMEGQELHMAVQSEKSIILQSGNANANLCLLQVVGRKL
ncbi:MAG: hypothetical protein UEE41_07685 [Acutalibacteraceae bacterium]|nr:hypothetical protein [Acutalibacteraceae bacterium]